MKTIKIPNLEYPNYNDIREALMADIPFAIILIDYNRTTKTAVISFWDSSYIPENLKRFILPFNPSLMAKVNQKFKTIST